MSQFNAERRRFLRTASIVSGSVGAAGAPFALNLASLGTAVAQTAPDYKAIVCLFLYGGNDSSNMVLRTDTASFAEYTRMRNTGQDPIALLAPGTAANGGAARALAGAPRRRAADRAQVHRVSTENAANTYALHPEHARGAGPVRRGPARRAGQRRAARRAAQPRRVHLELQAAAAGARLAQRPAVDLAGARPRGRQDRLGRPPRRHGREQQHQRRVHEHLGLGQRRLLGRRHDLPVPGRQRRRGGDRRHHRLALQLGDGGDDAEDDHHGRQLAPVRQGIQLDRQPLDQRAGDVPDGVQRVDDRGADAVLPAVDRQQRHQRPGPAAADGRPRDRRALGARRQAPGVLRLDGRLRHPRHPEPEPGRPAGAHLACARLLRHGARRTSAASTCATT